VNLEGRVGIVFGGASGIGRATAESLADKGEIVVIADPNEAMGVEVAAEIRAAGGIAESVVNDITEEDAVAELIRSAEERHGRIDTVVTSAGAASGDWHRGIDLFLKGPYYVSRHALPALERAGGGTLIHVGSVASIRGSIAAVDVDGTSYPTAKHGLVGLSKTLALTYGPKNIRVNVVCPGYIKTRLTQPLYESPGGEDYPRDHLRVPLGRWGEAEDIGRVAAFLATDDASFISGQTIVVDGGLTAR
jgi:NAD(P)-dependent dehydrogenase (short-subunit alcohol dehydrogenase family)